MKSKEQKKTMAWSEIAAMVDRILLFKHEDETLQEYSKKLGIPRENFPRWRSGQRPLHVMDVLVIACKLDVDPKWIMFGINPPLRLEHSLKKLKKRA